MEKERSGEIGRDGDSESKMGRKIKKKIGSRSIREEEQRRKKGM